MRVKVNKFYRYNYNLLPYSYSNLIVDVIPSLGPKYDFKFIMPDDKNVFKPEKIFFCFKKDIKILPYQLDDNLFEI